VKLTGVHTHEPQLRLQARAGDAKLSQATLRLPHGLRFEGGNEWRSGASASAGGRHLPANALRHTSSGLSVRAKGSGASRLSVQVGDGALSISHLPKGRLQFPVTVRDRDGHTTRLVAKVRPRR
jgi:hypothetical protein